MGCKSSASDCFQPAPQNSSGVQNRTVQRDAGSFVMQLSAFSSARSWPRGTRYGIRAVQGGATSDRPPWILPRPLTFSRQRADTELVVLLSLSARLGNDQELLSRKLGAAGIGPTRVLSSHSAVQDASANISRALFGMTAYLDRVAGSHRRNRRVFACCCSQRTWRACPQLLPLRRNVEFHHQFMRRQKEDGVCWFAV